jgi:hypothetical protein
MTLTTPRRLIRFGQARRLTQGSFGQLIELNPHQLWEMPLE